MKKTLVAMTLAGALFGAGASTASADEFGRGFGPGNGGYAPYYDNNAYSIYNNYGSYTYTDTTAVATTTSTVATTSSSDNTYPIGQCTWGVKELAPWAGNWWGNGGDWAASAQAAGFAVGTTPQVGAIIVWTDGGYGHVAYVTDVSSDGLIQVQESNYAGNMSIANYRGWFNPYDGVTPGVVSYIYPNA